MDAGWCPERTDKMSFAKVLLCDRPVTLHYGHLRHLMMMQSMAIK